MVERQDLDNFTGSRCVNALHPSQQFFSHVRLFSCLPGLNQYNEKDIVWVHGFKMWTEKNSSQNRQILQFSFSIIIINPFFHEYSS